MYTQTQPIEIIGTVVPRPTLSLCSKKTVAYTVNISAAKITVFPGTEGPRLTRFWDLEKTVLHEPRVSGTVLWSPTNANSPTYTYISQKTC